MKNKPKIELLYFDDCPNHRDTAQQLRDTLTEMQLDVEVEEIKVVDNEDAVRKRFLGSPSIRINNRDLEIEETKETEYSMRCRIYRTETEATGLPSKELLRSALLAATNGI